ncbi:MAG TPA: hypothetical protein PKX48_13315 [Planctomycetota bacterium]|jgi:hypothetical protein|nr:hypothetical protein [Planctomycetota bacterium]HNR99956.1 hypothetical protein [Planctomycetota bacterium]HNU25664.1 hypothetical protein [Planctomycetota bacterium]HOE31104.1 hypothetical protein [Planctomycetota bacterium]HOE88055.1 hypothetical protein [Planctomycetota bacterium]
MHIYWSLKQLPELAGLSRSERNRRWRAACWRSFRHWQIWVALAIAGLCSGAGTRVGAVLGRSFAFSLLGAGIGGAIGGFVFLQIATPVIRRYLRAPEVHQDMKITINSHRFDALQLRLLEELINSIRTGLKKAGITDVQTLREATGNIAFSVAEIIDGSCVMELDGEPVVPVLTFAKEVNGTDLVAAKGGSWMHEAVFGTVDDMFDSGSAG